MPGGSAVRLGDLVADLHRRLGARGATVATAESLTGGLLGGALTLTAGSSATFRGGVVAYATDLKVALLGVDAALLAERGPVDVAVAARMAEGVRELLGASFGVATTGVAGPGPQSAPAGGTVHPAGTVHVAVAGDAGVVTSSLALAGARDRVRELTVMHALDLLGRVLHEGPDLSVDGAGARSDDPG
jgi:PncC family amidohydrolase